MINSAGGDINCMKKRVYPRLTLFSIYILSFSSSLDWSRIEVVHQDYGSSTNWSGNYILPEEAERNGWGLQSVLATSAFCLPMLVFHIKSKLLPWSNAEYWCFYWWQTLRNTVIPEPPMFKPEFPPQGSYLIFYETLVKCFEYWQILLNLIYILGKFHNSSLNFGI